jgi:hypothetical protein
MTRAETQQLFKQAGFESKSYITYPEPNPQHIYHEMYMKNPIYEFADDVAKSTMQQFINNFKSAPKTYESLITLVPNRLQQPILENYKQYIESGFSDVWDEINQTVSLAIILQAVNYTQPINGINYIKADDINRAIQDLM